jgi:hypothetical protein
MYSLTYLCEIINFNKNVVFSDLKIEYEYSFSLGLKSGNFKELELNKQFAFEKKFLLPVKKMQYINPKQIIIFNLLNTTNILFLYLLL